jgi:hypothetical protein
MNIDSSSMNIVKGTFHFLHPIKELIWKVKDKPQPMTEETSELLIKHQRIFKDVKDIFEGKPQSMTKTSELKD